MVDSEGVASLSVPRLAVASVILMMRHRDVGKGRTLLSYFLRVFVPTKVAECLDPLGASSGDLDTLSLMIGSGVISTRRHEAARKMVKSRAQSYVAPYSLPDVEADEVNGLVADLVGWLEAPKAPRGRRVLLEKLRSRPSHAGHFVVRATNGT